MDFDTDNTVVKLCVQGMNEEGAGNPQEALRFFQKAWDEARDDFERFTAAHYVARHQATIADKLHWNTTALHYALKADKNSARSSLPSLYLNVAQCYEDIGDLEGARNNYGLAYNCSTALPDNGYGGLIRRGIMNGMKRVKR
jgi:tetratricopeptide (TPR) repeat protein